MLHGHWDHDNREFRALRFVDRRGVGRYHLVQFVKIVANIPLVEADDDFPFIGVDGRDHADVPVEHILVVVVLGLHHLVPEPELPTELFHNRFIGPDRVECILQQFIECPHPKGSAVHGAEHLHVVDRVAAQFPGDPLPDHLQEGKLDGLGLLALDKEEIRFRTL